MKHLAYWTAILALMAVIGCGRPHWKGNRCYIRGRECGWVWSDKQGIHSYHFDLGPRGIAMEHVSGGGRWPTNQYADKIQRLEVEEYCATEFYYYGEGSEPYSGKTEDK